MNCQQKPDTKENAPFRHSMKMSSSTLITSTHIRVPQIRNPNIEAPNKHESRISKIRNANAEVWNIRIWKLFRISRFEFRILRLLFPIRAVRKIMINNLLAFGRARFVQFRHRVLLSFPLRFSATNHVLILSRLVRTAGNGHVSGVVRR